MILLDMDGVIVDFVAGLEAIYGKAPRNDTWEMHEWWEMEHDDFWHVMEHEEFWTGLKGYNNWMAFYKELKRYKEVVFCTSPSTYPASASGKVKWLHMYLGDRFENYIITKDKTKLATITDAILIDDKILPQLLKGEVR